MSTSEPCLAALRGAWTDALLAAADDDFLLGHADSDWTGVAPMLEEDIAFSSIAQDEIAHAREWYRIVGSLLGRSADEVAYGRKPPEYRCAALVVRADEFDWALLIARQFYYDHFDALRLRRLTNSSHDEAATVARRILAEEQFHVHHADDWVRRLAGGTPESRRRVKAALQSLWGDALGLFEPLPREAELASAGLLPAPGRPLLEQWIEDVSAVLRGCGLETGPLHQPAGPGGRCGRHEARLTEVLDELCAVHRLEPNAVW